MESGTILHLALLRKISNQQATIIHYREKFNNFRKREFFSEPNQYHQAEDQPNHEEITKEKYKNILMDTPAHLQRKQNLKINKINKASKENKKKQKIDQNITISGWSTDNLQIHQDEAKQKRYCKPKTESKARKNAISYRDKKLSFLSHAELDRKYNRSGVKIEQNSGESIMPEQKIQIYNLFKIKSKKKVTREEIMERKLSQIKPVNISYTEIEKQNENPYKKSESDKKHAYFGQIHQKYKIEDIMPMKGKHNRIGSFQNFVSELNLKFKMKKLEIL